MSDTLHPNIQRAIEGNYSFSIGDSLSEAWEVFKSNILGFVLLALIILVGSFIFSLIPFIGSLIYSLIVVPCLVVGFFIGYEYYKRAIPGEIGDLFDGFKRWTDLAIAQLVISIIMMVILTPFFLIAFGSAFFSLFTMDSGMNLSSLEMGFFGGLMFLLGILAAFVVYAFLLYVIPLVYYYNESVTDALKHSFEIVKQDLVKHLALTLLIILLTIGGAILCGVGLLVTFPLVYLLIIIIFDKIVGLPGEPHVEPERDSDPNLLSDQ